MNNHFDVVVLGAGLAGLSLARQLTLVSDKRILLLEKRAQVPPVRQKVGEATVQLSGYYFSKVLDLEDHLLQEHLMKYNLRFYWKTQKDGSSYEHYSQSYIRNLSNIASYQLDRNKIEAELLRRNRQAPTFTFLAGVSDLVLGLSEDKAHVVRFRVGSEQHEVRATWVIDATGRSRVLARDLQLTKSNPIHHGACFFWVDGLVNIEKLSDLSPRESRLNKNRRMTGHLPVWLATNHFVGEGYWFWVIPLHGKTSLGLVYDRDKVSPDLVSTPAKTIDWVCENFPLFARDLKSRTILDQGMFRDFSYDCQQTISDSRWALTGEAGRFTDPLYSPGGDLIALHNTFITDCILTDDSRRLSTKTRVYEVLMRALYQAYVPSYAVSYEVLGDQECFTMKYAWELAVYFTFFVFPFINELFTDLGFAASYLREFARLGELNRSLQQYITDYYRWKKLRYDNPTEPQFFDFMELGALRSTERLFYEVGLTATEAATLLAQESVKLTEFARYIVAHICASVSGRQSLLQDRHFIAGLDLDHLVFDVELICQRAECSKDTSPPYSWGFDAQRLLRLQGTRKQEATQACAAD
jgi:flavin-dependent dehydrogenase